MDKGKIVIYKSKDNRAELRVKLEKENIWLDAHQMAQIFGTQRPAVVKHINNIYKTKELDKNSTCSILEQVAADKKIRKMNLYNLDMILSVGYRVNSKHATQFRVWATGVLRNYIVKGVVINEKRIKETRLKELEGAIKLLKSAQNKQLSRDETAGLLSVITDYADSWILLQKYDEDKLKIQKGRTSGIKSIAYEFAGQAIEKLKQDLLKKKEAADIFGQERDRGLESILKNLEQSFGGKRLYPSIEEKAAHLLYFIIKNHPFVDGNKRIGSFLFVVFLSQNNYLTDKKGEKKINDNALVALALLVAESKPSEKDVMLALITNLL
ncbi:type II toxin-antitoxin system death-on-curing family toxin [Patescibacteria group bacterium]|nr:type II toxin-antitoxin system death-on-curing family toxin [Patescibacteria group bacterium]